MKKGTRKEVILQYENGRPKKDEQGRLVCVVVWTTPEERAENARLEKQVVWGTCNPFHPQN